jgi:hypothetical protein
MECVPVMKRVLGPENPVYLRTLSDYAYTVALLFRVDEAEAMLTEALPLQTLALGSEHHITKDTIRRLAMVRQAREVYDASTINLCQTHVERSKKRGENPHAYRKLPPS